MKRIFILATRTKKEGIELYKKFIEGGSLEIHEKAGYNMLGVYDKSNVNEKEMKLLDNIFDPAKNDIKVYKGVNASEFDLEIFEQGKKKINYTLSSTTTEKSVAEFYSTQSEEMIPVIQNITIKKGTPIADARQLLGKEGMRSFEKEITISRNAEESYSNLKLHEDKYGDEYYTVDVIIKRKHK